MASAGYLHARIMLASSSGSLAEINIIACSPIRERNILAVDCPWKCSDESKVIRFQGSPLALRRLILKLRKVLFLLCLGLGRRNRNSCCYSRCRSRSSTLLELVRLHQLMRNDYSNDNRSCEERCEKAPEHQPRFAWRLLLFIQALADVGLFRGELLNAL